MSLSTTETEYPAAAMEAEESVALLTVKRYSMNQDVEYQVPIFRDHL